jgi:hypothetical protein
MSIHSRIFRARRARPSFAIEILVLGVAAALFFAGAASAAGAKVPDAQARYQQERAVCMSGQSNQDRATCLREAGAALQEAKRGNLGAGDEHEFKQNSLTRCDGLPAQDRDDCVRRMSGEGTVSGSAQQGGVYRELTSPVVPRN